MSERIRIRGGTIDLARRRIAREDQEQVLTPLEARLLGYLSRHRDRDVPREELQQQVWGRDDGGSRAVDAMVRRLRQKLGEPDPPEVLLTAHGVGYRLVPYAPLASAAPLEAAPAPPRRLVRTACGLLDLDRQIFEPSGGGSVPLTRLEVALLEHLARSLRQPVPLDELIRQIWGRGQHRSSAAAAISRLRKKVERDPSRPEVVVTAPNGALRLEGERVHHQRTNLAPLSSSFVCGLDLERLADLAVRHQLLTLVGTAGIGKTRLARQLGALRLSTRPLAEVWFADLAPVFDRRGIAEVVAGLLGLDPAGGELEERVGRVLALRPQGSVLILDNYEHLVGCAEVVSLWQAAAPEVSVWVTSRVALGLVEERVVEVPVLEEEAAVRLFLERADPSARGSQAIAPLVKRLDGLPLAIELAAARTRQLSPEQLLLRIGRRLDLLVRPGPDNQSHHSTLRGAIDWSWELLEEPERRALRRLSVLASPFDADTADALLGEHARQQVEELVARSLVQVQGPGRWRLLEAIREYAAEKLAISGELAHALARRADWFLALAEPNVEHLDGPQGAIAVRSLRGIRDELVAVWRSASDDETASRAALAVAELEQRSEYTPLAVEMLDGALARSPSEALAWRLGWHRAVASQFAGALTRTREQLLLVLPVAERHSPLAKGILWLHLGLAEARLSDPVAAERWLTDARALFLSLGEARGAARALASLAYLTLRTSADPSAALAALTQATDELRNAGALRHLAVALLQLGEGRYYQGERRLAEAHIEEAFATARAAGDLRNELRILHHRAILEQETGALRRAEAQYLELERRLHEIGSSHEAQLIQTSRMTAALERGDFATAEALCPPVGTPWANTDNHAALLINHAVLRTLQGRHADARAILGPLVPALEPLPRYWSYANAYLAAACALDGAPQEAEQRLEQVRGRTDPTEHGFARLLALCQAILLLARDRRTDPRGALAKAQATLDAGALIRSDEGLLLERPQDVNFARMILLRQLGAGAP